MSMSMGCGMCGGGGGCHTASASDDSASAGASDPDTDAHSRAGDPIAAALGMTQHLPEDPLAAPAAGAWRFSADQLGMRVSLALSRRASIQARAPAPAPAPPARAAAMDPVYMEDVLDALPVMVHIVDNRLRIEYQNRASLRAYGKCAQLPCAGMLGATALAAMRTEVLGARRTWRWVGPHQAQAQAQDQAQGQAQGHAQGQGQGHVHGCWHGQPQPQAQAQPQVNSVGSSSSLPDSDAELSAAMAMALGCRDDDPSARAPSAAAHAAAAALGILPPSATASGSGAQQPQPQQQQQQRQWYDVICRPFIQHTAPGALSLLHLGDGGRGADKRRRLLIMVTQTNVTRHVRRTDAVLRVADWHLRLLQQMYPRQFIVETSMQHAHLLRTSQSMSGGHAQLPDLQHFARRHECVAIMFCDMVGFTSMCRQVQPEAVMTFLTALYAEFDQALDLFPLVHKYEVAGDCYIAVAGLADRDPLGFLDLGAGGAPASGAALAARQILKFAVAVRGLAASAPMPHNGSPVCLRIGLHAGPVVSGIIGVRSPRFMLFGDTINTASRMESTCPDGHLQASEELYQLLDGGPSGGPSSSGDGGDGGDDERDSKHGMSGCAGVWRHNAEGVNVKGRGVMRTWVLHSAPPSLRGSLDMEGAGAGSGAGAGAAQ